MKQNVRPCLRACISRLFSSAAHEKQDAFYLLCCAANFHYQPLITVDEFKNNLRVLRLLNNKIIAEPNFGHTKVRFTTEQQKTIETIETTVPTQLIIEKRETTQYSTPYDNGHESVESLFPPFLLAIRDTYSCACRGEVFANEFPAQQRLRPAAVPGG